MVFILALGTTLKTAQMLCVSTPSAISQSFLTHLTSSLSVWEQSVVYFGDVTGAVAISYTKWWQTGGSLMVRAWFHYLL